MKIQTFDIQVIYMRIKTTRHILADFSAVSSAFVTKSKPAELGNKIDQLLCT